MESIKVVLIGDSGVGKTSIISRFTKDTFNNEEMSSSSAQFTSKTIQINDQSIKFDIWDTAGQEKFRALAKIFYKDAQVIILVYEIINKESFESIKNYWYKESSENSTADIFFVVGNKSDLYENEQVTDEEGKKFAKEINAIFKITSALSNTGIDRLFESIGKKILNPNYTEDGINDLSNSIPKNNVNIINKKEGRNTIKLNNDIKNNGKEKKRCCRK
jgi:small GTP-binding protein